MDSRDRVRLAVRHRTPDRVPKHDNFWEDARRDLLIEAGVHPDADIYDVFDLDVRAYWFDGSARFDVRTVREDEREIVVTNEWGATVRSFRDSQTTGEHLDFAVVSRPVWEETHRARYAFDRRRLDVKGWKRLYEYWRRTGRYVMFGVVDPFEATWMKVGPVRHMELYGEDHDWLRDLYDVHTRLVEDAFAELRGEGFEFDGVWFWADVAYKNGPMISPAAYREILQPYHRRLTGMAHGAGADTFFHSDGNLDRLFPLLIESGFDAVHPLEVKAGMDVRALKPRHGDRLAFVGNIDARLYQENDLPGLEREIREKVGLAKAGGGYVYHSDHSVPPGVRLATYRRVLELVDFYGRS